MNTVLINYTTRRIDAGVAEPLAQPNGHDIYYFNTIILLNYTTKHLDAGVAEPLAQSTGHDHERAAAFREPSKVLGARRVCLLVAQPKLHSTAIDGFGAMVKPRRALRDLRRSRIV